MAASISIFTEDGQTVFDIPQDVASYIEGLNFRLRTTEQDRDQYKFWYENETIKFVAAADEITVLSREIESLRAQLKAAEQQRDTPEKAIAAQGELIKGESYESGLWSMRSAEAMIRDGNVINGLSPAVSVPVEVTPEMLRAAQLHSELGGFACSNWSGGYDCITELFNVMISAASISPSPRITEQDAREIAEDFTAFRDGVLTFDHWLDIGDGRALLNKLNDKPESVGG